MSERALAPSPASGDLQNRTPVAKCCSSSCRPHRDNPTVTLEEGMPLHMPDCCIEHMHADAPSSSGRRFVIPRNEIPVELLVAKHDARKVPSNALCSTAELRQAHKDAAWAGKREYMLAAAAAGVHLAMFAWNLAFWGFEGMPPDRWVRLAFSTRSLLTEAPLGCNTHLAEASHSRDSV